MPGEQLPMRDETMPMDEPEEGPGPELPEEGGEEMPEDPFAGVDDEFGEDDFSLDDSDVPAMEDLTFDLDDFGGDLDL